MAGETMIALALATALAVQQQPADVVVTARPKPAIETIRKRVASITRRSNEQVARFTQPVCAGTIGLPDLYGTRVAERMTAVARAAGVDTAKPGCRPNITLVIVDDGRELLTELRRRKPTYFNALPTGEVERALAERGPARVITLTQTLSRDGNALSADYTSGNASGLAGGAPTLLVNSASIITLATRQDITGSLVLIDTRATLGKTLTQLADYAAMRALAKTDARASTEDDTILSLFAAGAAPRAMTAFDTAFLKALYHGPATLKYNTKVADMAREIAGS